MMLVHKPGGRDRGRGAAHGGLECRRAAAQGGRGSWEAWAAGPLGLPDLTEAPRLGRWLDSLSGQGDFGE